jgi:YhcH/YjgK/YiaL family protein
MSTEKEWFENGDWNKSLRLKVHPSVDVNQFYKQYHKHPDLWKAAFSYLKNDLIDAEIGRHQLVGDEAVAIISEYKTKKIEDAKWESHRKFIDLQYIISGEEKMGVLPLAVTKLADDYDETKDLIFYGDQDGEYYLANPDVFFLFFPSDVHRPSIRIGESKPVKKLVIKIAFVE